VSLQNKLDRLYNRAFPNNILKASRREAAAILERNGFVCDTPPKDALKPYQPWIFQEPDLPTFHARGMVGGADVEIYHYDVERTGDDPSGEAGVLKTELLALVHHPLIAGEAKIQPDVGEWSKLAKVIDAVAWLPPFTVLTAAEWGIRQVLGRNHPDRNLGHPEFDRLYLIHSPSDEIAARAVPPALRELLLRMKFFGKIELRQGLMMLTVEKADLTILELGRLMEPLPWLVSAVLPAPGPFR